MEIIILGICLMIFSYLCGSLTFGKWLTWRFLKVDITKFGSGNIGAMNVFRIDKPLGILVLLLEAGKGFSATYIAVIMGFVPAWQVSIGFMSLIGHTFSCFFEFKGGKAVATTLGVILALGFADPILMKIAGTGLAIYLLVVATSKYSSAGSLSGVWSIAIMNIIFQRDIAYTAFFLIVAIFVTYLHRSNIVRLLNGTESTIYDKPTIKKGCGEDARR